MAADRLRWLVVATSLVAAIGCGNGDDDGAPAPRVPTDDFEQLVEIYQPPLDEMGLEVTRADIVALDERTHLALYAVPGQGTPSEPASYLERLLPSVQALLPLVFERYPGLDSFDLCQEPVDAAAESPPPVTVVLLTREHYAALDDWSQATLPDLITVARSHPLGQVDVAAEVAALPGWTAAGGD